VSQSDFELLPGYESAWAYCQSDFDVWGSGRDISQTESDWAAHESDSTGLKRVRLTHRYLFFCFPAKIYYNNCSYSQLSRFFVAPRTFEVVCERVHELVCVRERRIAARALPRCCLCMSMRALLSFSLSLTHIVTLTSLLPSFSISLSHSLISR
jgi:hypothetical protein